jgi:glucan phosphoethanolaminetransferase (alkaline phosphatase superfamily)
MKMTVQNIIYRKDRIWMLLLSIIVLLPNIYFSIIGSYLTGNLFRTIIYLGGSFLLFLTPFLLFKVRTLFLIYGLFVLLSPFEIVHIYLNKTTISSGYILAILGTDWHESIEVLSAIKFFIFCFFIIDVVYFYILFVKIENTYLIRKMKTRFFCLLAAVFILFIGFLSLYVSQSRIVNEKEKDRLWAKTTKIFKLKFHKIYPYNLILRTHEAVLMRKDINSLSGELAHFTFSAKKNRQLNEKEVYVFVIGETARYSNFSINGYKRETSPLLSEMENLVSYSDLYSGANLTHLSLPIILTRVSAQNYDQYAKEKTFVDAFKEAVFKTYWIANQSADNSFIQRISEDADDKFFTINDFDTHALDEQLWEAFDQILSRKEEKIFIVLHTLGSHFRYNFRYPEAFEVFKPALKDAFNYTLISPKNKELLVNSYDNSILYTDYFLANTIKKLDSLNCNSYLMYVADHGENLFDTEDNIWGHAGSIYSNYDFHVPFFVWYSDEYKKNYPEKVDAVIENKDKKLSTNNIFYSILDMADIDFPEFLKEKSISSTAFIEDSVRYILTTDIECKIFEE